MKTTMVRYDYSAGMGAGQCAFAQSAVRVNSRRPALHPATPAGQGQCILAGPSGCLESGVFFPAAGNVNGTSLNNGGSNGNYWSSSLNTSNTSNAYNLNFNSSNVNPQNNNNRYNGFPVRPVSELAQMHHYE